MIKNILATYVGGPMNGKMQLIGPEESRIVIFDEESSRTHTYVANEWCMQGLWKCCFLMHEGLNVRSMMLEDIIRVVNAGHGVVD